MALALPHNENSLWTIKSHSSMAIYGSSNVNKFACVMPKYNKESKLNFYAHRLNNGLHKVKGQIVIPLSCFDCGHRIMTQDFYKFLKHNEYPDMLINFKYFSKIPDKNNSKKECLTGCLNISLAGCQKDIFIDFESHHHSDLVSLKGIAEIKFSDFDLTPPTKFGGAVKVKNDLVVEINLEMAKNPQ